MIEDCNKMVEELTVCDETKKIVILVTHDKTNDSDREKIMDSYYEAIVAQIESMLDIYKRLM